MNPRAMGIIQNDDEEDYISGGNSVGAYNGSDPGTGGIASGPHFRGAAEYYYVDQFDVASWADVIAELTAYVSLYGRISNLGIVDHGTIDGQLLNWDLIAPDQFAELAPLLDDGALITLFGCHVGLNPVYCNMVADYAGPDVTVTAADSWVIYVNPPGTVAPVDLRYTLLPNSAAGQWLTFNGLGE